jgi:hypothetical protein
VSLRRLAIAATAFVFIIVIVPLVVSVALGAAV